MRRIDHQRGEVLNGCTFIAESHTKMGKTRNVRYGWFICPYCDNGFNVSIRDVRYGNTSSCGCLARKLSKERMASHGLRYHKLYTLYAGMKARCLYPSSLNYKYYGACGVSVYQPWLDDFQLFYDYMVSLDGYDESLIGVNGLTMDRLDNARGYEPGNMRWADRHTQSANTNISIKNTSGYTGVTYGYRKYVSRITVNGVRHVLGRYTTKKAAVVARNNYIKENELWEYPIQKWIG